MYVVADTTLFCNTFLLSLNEYFINLLRDIYNVQGMKMVLYLNNKIFYFITQLPCNSLLNSMNETYLEMKLNSTNEYNRANIFSFAIIALFFIVSTITALVPNDLFAMIVVFFFFNFQF